MKRIATALGLTCACLLAQAQGSNWRFMAGAGLANGGETIQSGVVTEVGTTHEMPFQIKAGGGPQFRIGADYRIAERVTLQASVGRSVDDPMGYNGSLTFTTAPVELLAFVNLTDAIRLGGGLRRSSGKMRGTGVAADWPSLGRYTGNGGAVAELQYLFSHSDSKASASHTQFGISLRWVKENLTRDEIKFGGKHYEIGAVLYF